VYINDPRLGKWTGTAGYADVEHQVPIGKDEIFSLASIGKMYNAVAVLKLSEESRLHLDDKISRYLSKDIVDRLPSGSDVTIRHLLGHRSGFDNYELDPELNRLYITGRLKLDTLSKREALERYLYGKPALCKPGEAYHYSSTNYLLLAMIMDAVVPEGHTHYLRTLLKQYGFHHTYYRETPPDTTLKYYGDPDTDGRTENLTDETLETTNWFTGDDGIYAPIEEAARFLEDLVQGKILQEKTLKEMIRYDDKDNNFGLGLTTDRGFPYKILLGHSGRGIGVTTDLYYFPRHHRTVAIFCNRGTRGSLPEIRKTYRRMREKIVKKLFIF
jgi:D-alanyl-D-alanine carboxypeptidase